MRQLPCASDTKDSKLNERPLHNPSVRRFGLVSELGLTLLPKFVSKSILFQHCRLQRSKNNAKTYSRINLLPPNILQPSIQIPHSDRQIRQLRLITTLNRTRLSNRQIQNQFNTAVILATDQPTPRQSVTRGQETDAVFTRIGGGESEASLGVAALVDDSVVGVEGFFDGYLETQAAVGFESFGLGVVLLDFVVA